MKSLHDTEDRAEHNGCESTTALGKVEAPVKLKREYNERRKNVVMAKEWKE